MDYERAAELRDICFALEKTVRRTRRFTRVTPESEASVSALADLSEQLQLDAPPETIECFDISHISGSFCVASMVQFSGGKAAKANYRRFRIKEFVGNDDFRAMREVVGRRYRRLDRENRPMPDLIVIDGGRGQVSAALRAFLEAELEPPAMIGLAKKEETIIFSDRREPLQLPAHSPARRLLQQIRDEAHRFANSYNADLRRKRMQESILNDFDGIGKSKEAAIWTRFGNLRRLRLASVEDLCEVPGIGKKTAQRLHQFLQKAT